MNRLMRRISRLEQQCNAASLLPRVVVDATNENALEIIENAQRAGRDITIDTTAIKKQSMYLDYEILVYNGWDCVQRFMELSACATEEEYMAAYIQTLKEFCEIPEIDYNPVIYSHSVCISGHWLTDDELRADAIERSKRHRETVLSAWQDVLKRSGDGSLLILADLLGQMDRLPVLELVERYRDRRISDSELIENPYPQLYPQVDNA